MYLRDSYGERISLCRQHVSSRDGAFWDGDALDTPKTMAEIWHECHAIQRKYGNRTWGDLPPREFFVYEETTRAVVTGSFPSSPAVLDLLKLSPDPDSGLYVGRLSDVGTDYLAQRTGFCVLVGDSYYPFISSHIYADSLLRKVTVLHELTHCAFMREEFGFELLYLDDFTFLDCDIWQHHLNLEACLLGSAMMAENVVKKKVSLEHAVDRRRVRHTLFSGFACAEKERLFSHVEGQAQFGGFFALGNDGRDRFIEHMLNPNHVSIVEIAAVAAAYFWLVNDTCTEWRLSSLPPNLDVAQWALDVCGIKESSHIP